MTRDDRRVPELDRAKLSFVGAVAALSFFKLWLSAAEISAQPWQAFDEGLFVRHAESILAGNWLGPFDQYTLVKGPLFPLFLALSHVARIPLPVAQEALYVAACLATMGALRPLLKSRAASLAVLVPLLFCPVNHLTGRLLRDPFYAALVLLAVAGAIAVLLRPRVPVARCLGWAACLGSAVGCVWVTREEGIALVPFLGVAALLTYVSRVRAAAPVERRAARRTAAILVAAPFLIAAVPVSAVVAANGVRYGAWTVTEMSHARFVTAFGTLCGIDAAEKERRVPVSLASLGRVYGVSPAARELRPYLDGPGSVWKAGGTDLVPPGREQEYKGGYFLWAFRDAVAAAGHYGSWPDAADYYGRLADELERGTKEGQLKGAGRRRSLVPPLGARDAVPLLGTFRVAVKELTSLSEITGAEPEESSGAPDGIRRFESLARSSARPAGGAASTAWMRARYALRRAIAVTWRGGARLGGGLGAAALVLVAAAALRGNPDARGVLSVCGPLLLLIATRLVLLSVVDYTSFHGFSLSYLMPLLPPSAVLALLPTVRVLASPREFLGGYTPAPSTP